jgi:hypothetical protein
MTVFWKLDLLRALWWKGVMQRQLGYVVSYGPSAICAFPPLHEVGQFPKHFLFVIPEGGQFTNTWQYQV